LASIFIFTFIFTSTVGFIFISFSPCSIVLFYFSAASTFIQASSPTTVLSPSLFGSFRAELTIRDSLSTAASPAVAAADTTAAHLADLGLYSTWFLFTLTLFLFLYCYYQDDRPSCTTHHQ